QSSLFADPEIDYYQLASTKAEPSSYVGGLVNVITGDVIFSKNFLFVEGAEPITLPHLYSSRPKWLSKGVKGWTALYCGGASYNLHECTIWIWDKEGVPFLYKIPLENILFKGKDCFKKYDEHLNRKKGEMQRLVLNEECFKAGLTNCSGSEISARYNLKNTKASLRWESPLLEIQQPNGGKLTYVSYEKINFKSVMKGPFKKIDCYLFLLFNYKSLNFHLISEKFPNGNQMIYEYEILPGQHMLRPSRIRTTNPSKTKTYAEAKYSYLSYAYLDADISTSDGKTFSFRFTPQGEGVSLLSQLIFADQPDESMTYYCDDDRAFITKKTCPENRSIEFSYENFRVKEMKAPIGKKGEMKTLYRFSYKPGEVGQRGGSTTVYDADNNKTEYFYSSAYRLETLKHYEKETLSYIEKLVWGKDNTPEVTCLLCKSYFDANSNPIFSKRFFYDTVGNIIRERFYGNLSGTCIQKIALDGNGLPIDNGIEFFDKKKTYEKQTNLLIKEQEDSGYTCMYSYYPGTDLLVSKFICDGENIKIREFYEYDSDLILIQRIVDDGSSPKKENLLHVTERKIYTITPKTDNPFICKPHIIEEKYLDLQTQQEVLIKKVVVTYSPQGKIAKEDFFDNTNTFRYSKRYEYDTKGRLIAETNPLGQKALYEYDVNFNKTFSQDFGNKLSQKCFYDYSNRLTATEDRGIEGILHRTEQAYDLLSRRISSTDYLGHVTAYKYNALGKLLETHFPKTLDEMGKEASLQTSSEYNAAGFEITSKDPKGFVTKKEYNAYGKPTKIAYPDGTVESFFYNKDGSLLSHLDPEGVQMTYTYDFLQRETSKTISYKEGIQSTETKTYNSFHLLSETDPEGYKKLYTYDGAGRKKSEEREQEKSTFSYDSLGRLYKTIYSDVYVTIEEKDLLHRNIEERIESLDGKVLTQVQYTYDASGNRSSTIQTIQGKLTERKCLYDSFHRLVQEIDPLGFATNYNYLETASNSLGHRVLQKIQIDPVGLHTEETYDALDRLVSRIQKKEKTVSQEEMFYDGNSHLAKQVSTIYSSSESPHQVTTLWNYNSLNRLESLTEAYGTPLAKTTKYFYTPCGYLQKTIKPNSISITYAYNFLGDKVEIKTSDNTCKYTFAYNKLHSLVSAVDENTHQTITRKVDCLGNVKEETLLHGKTLSSEYDSLGRKIKLQFPDHSSVEYCYDSYFLSKIIRKDAFDNLLYEHQFLDYDLAGNLLHQKTLVGDLYTSFDPLNRKQGIESSPFSQKASFNPDGTISQMVRDNRETAYLYDDLKQLISEEGGFVVDKTYRFDSHFNRLQKDTECYEINDLNQIVSTPSIPYQYDLNGNPTKKGDLDYKYDALDRLIEISKPSQYCYRFTYDPLHRRVSQSFYQVSNGKWKEEFHHNYLYDEENEIGSFDTKIRELRILAPSQSAEIGASIAFEIEDKTYIPLHDLFGNVSVLLSVDTQEPIEKYYYTSFGEEKIVSSLPSINPWRFSSKRTDNSGLVFYGRRYYDPSTGRFFTPDPQGFTDSQNLYCFVLNDPLIRIDLYG
ncbi:MAG: RHS repeat-associated core domain-containing protein, partial [Chlamydiota bacterium]